jgi:hypothetical protein
MIEDDANWGYKSGASGGSDEGAIGRPSSAQDQNLTWSAKEFIEHDRGSGWYTMLVLGSAAIALVIYFITRDYFAVGATIVVGIIAAVYASHKPKELSYELTNKMIKVGERTYSYSAFKSFSVAHEGEHTSIVLEPVKRLVPPMTLYFPPEMEDQVADAIGNRLPMQTHQPSVTERLAHRLRI